MTGADQPGVVRPRLSASILLLRDGAGGLEVLMMKRADHLSFAPGAYVFPGGALDIGDNDRRLWRPLISGRLWRRDMPLRIAALRELWEETGLLHAGRTPGRPARMPKRNSFARLVARRGRLDTRSLVPFSHWITPDGLPKRFDTHFFAAPWRYGGRMRADGYEAVSLHWVSPRDLLAEWQAGETDLMFPTRLNLMKLSQADSVGGALQKFRRTPVLRTKPVISGEGNSRTVSISAGEGFGAVTATAREKAVEMPLHPPKKAKKS